MPSPLILPIFLPNAGCRQRCVFCNQRTMAGETPTPLAVRQWIASAIQKMDGHPKNRERQVAFYGGSFTALDWNDQASYLRAVQPFLLSGEIDSIRISTRPDAFDCGSFKRLRSFGVKTVEIGAQSMDDQVLSLSGRGHTARDTTSAVRRLIDSGFEVGIQLMIGLPGDSLGSFLATLDEIIELRPHFVRIHPTVVLRETPLESLWRTQRYSPLSLDEAVRWLKVGFVRLERACVSVARLGLQPTEDLKHLLVAGPYHPAFRQLVESTIALDLMTQLLNLCSNQKEILLWCHPKEISNLRGQRNENLHKLKERFRLSEICVKSSAQIEAGTFLLQTPRRTLSIRRRDVSYDNSGNPYFHRN